MNRINVPPRLTKLPKLLTIICVMLVVFQVIASNRLANTGLKITEVDQDVQMLTSENSDLREKIASESALLTIKQRAQELGFTKSAKPIYLSRDLPVALEMR